MQGAGTLGSSSSLNTASIASVSRLPDGITRTSSSGFGLPKSQVLYGNCRSTSVKRSCSEGSSFGRSAGTLRVLAVKADATANGSIKPTAPLQLKSPSGQFLAELLQSHPHLVYPAAEGQLDKLAKDRDAATGQEQSNFVGTDLALYKRIAELQAKERRNALEEIMYALIVQRFVEAGVSMVPKVYSLLGNQRVDYWPVQEEELESVHSCEALEMISTYMMLFVGKFDLRFDPNTIAQTSKLHMVHVYAAAVVYGYFLRRVDQRFQLEKSMKVLPPGVIEAEQASDKNNPQDGLVATFVEALVDSCGVKPSRLLDYMMTFDTKMLYMCSIIRSKESVSVIEKHIQALFGRPEIQITSDGSTVVAAVAEDEKIMLSTSGHRRLALEALAFGRFLWDVENYVDSHYNIVVAH